MKKAKIRILKAAVVVTALVLGLIACSTEAPAAPKGPAPDSDSGLAYEHSAKIPIDEEVYNITGQVVGDTSSITRQTDPAKGSLIGISDIMVGSFFGPIEAGKGFVRVRVIGVQPPTDLAPESRVVILKVTDTKASALLPGDTAEFRCRRHFESIAAVRKDAKFDVNKVGTWELDFCRMATPIFTPSSSAKGGG